LSRWVDGSTRLGLAAISKEKRTARARSAALRDSSTHAEEGILMFERKNVATAASDVLDGVSPYVDRLAHDEKLRQRLAAAITAERPPATGRRSKQASLVSRRGSRPTRSCARSSAKSVRSCRRRTVV